MCFSNIISNLFSVFRAYDKAAIKSNGREAVTNFERSNYGVDMNSEGRDEGTMDCLQDVVSGPMCLLFPTKCTYLFVDVAM